MQFNSESNRSIDCVREVKYNDEKNQRNNNSTFIINDMVFKSFPTCCTQVWCIDHFLRIFILFLGEFLVSAPNRVEKIQIGYAKQAKKMDMKRLKAVEWNILQTSCFEQDKENDTDNVNEAEKKKTNETGVESSTSFSHLYTNLAGSRLILLLFIRDHLCIT